MAVIDPGPDVESHIRALSIALKSATEVSILLTHSHSDHAGGALALARETGGEILGPPSYQPQGTGGARIGVLEGGEGISTDRGELVALDVPGHARHHLAYHWVDAGALFVGDLILGRGNTTWVGEYEGCVGDYLSSLDKVEALGATVLYPAHGPPVTDVPGRVDRFRKHRLDRLEEVRRAREANPGASPQELAAIIYGGELPEKVAGAARSAVEAALFHLDR